MCDAIVLCDIYVFNIYIYLMPYVNILCSDTYIVEQLTVWVNRADSVLWSLYSYFLLRFWLELYCISASI